MHHIASVIARTRTQALGPAFAAAEWALGRPAFPARELDARFPQVPAAVRLQPIALLLREGLIAQYEPEI